jgi:ABC-type dipeptide/oligopeptide/nickel transport system permease subunit
MPTALVVGMSVALTLVSDGVRRALDPQRIG